MAKLDRPGSDGETPCGGIEPPDPDRWSKICGLVEATLERPTEEQGVWLEEACGHDKALRQEVLDFLAAVDDAEKDGFLEASKKLPGQPAWEPLDAFSDELPPGGRRVGPYRLVRVLGRGGFGVVYLAERRGEFEKRVALKLIKRGLETRDVIRRFHNERQILADLEHPGIAHLLDGGTTDDGDPYFVMEYVEGKPINGYCDDRGLSIRQRLELFLTVCAAIRFAHQHLVVHRDIKPSNILVTASGDPKLLDFGIAKLLESDSATQTLTEAQAPMTLSYASPEQVLAQPITTASDVYSLGVLLYRLLAGRLPSNLDSGKNTLLMMKSICEIEPQPPSEVVDPGAGRLCKALRGDVDAIVLQALAKEPERRYSSVEQLAEDIRRHLDARPVLAHPPGLTYRCRKFVRRNLLAVALSTLVIWFLSAAMGIYYVQSEANKRQAGEIEQQRDFLNDLFRALDPDEREGAALTASDILDRGRRTLEAEPRQVGVYSADMRARLFDLLARAYRNLGYLEEARALHGQAVTSWRQHDGADHEELARLINNLGGICYRTGDYVCAETQFRRSLEMAERLGLSELGLVKKRNNLAGTLMTRGIFAEAEKHYKLSLEIRRRYREHPNGQRYFSSSLNNLGALYLMRRDLPTAERYLREALQTREEHLGAKHSETALVLDRLGQVRHRLGAVREAELLFERALLILLDRKGETHPEVARARVHLANVRLQQGNLTETELLLDQALPVLRDRAGKRDIAEAESLQGALRTRQGRFSEAEVLLRESYRTLLAERSARDIFTQEARRRLSLLYEKRGDPSRPPLLGEQSPERRPAQGTVPP